MENLILNALPSIKESISVQYSQALQKHVIDETDSDDEDHNYDSADEDFTFSILTEDGHNKTSGLTADEIFLHGHILPLQSFSVRTLLSMDDTNTIQPEAVDETPDMPKTAPGSPIKSWSTGSIRRRNPIHQFLFGGRSHSDGKEKLGFFEKGSSSSVSDKKKKKKKDKGKGKRKESNDLNKTDYTKNGEKAIIVRPKEKDVLTRRRSFLPYIGFFGGGPMNGFTKKFFP